MIPIDWQVSGQGTPVRQLFQIVQFMTGRTLHLIDFKLGRLMSRCSLLL